jgi:hypothetical protein
VGVELVFDLADELLEDVLERDPANDRSVFIEHQREVAAVAAHLPQHFVEPGGLGHAGQRPRERACIDVRLPEGDPEQVLGVDEADGVLEPLPGVTQRQPGVTAVHRPFGDVARRLGNRCEVDSRARR